MSPLVLAVLHGATLAYALVGGVFLAFSDFIMRALAQTGGSGAVTTMQSINREVFRWIFMVMFIGLAPLSLVIAGYGALAVGGAAGTALLLAGLVYVVACFGVTVLFNVPMNEALARMEVGSQAASDYWARTYLPRWTVWNTVRACACTLASALLLLGLTLMAR